jgi:hypothetical protein
MCIFSVRSLLSSTVAPASPTPLAFAPPQRRARGSWSSAASTVAAAAASLPRAVPDAISRRAILRAFLTFLAWRVNVRRSERERHGFFRHDFCPRLAVASSCRSTLLPASLRVSALVSAISSAHAALAAAFGDCLGAALAVPAPAPARSVSAVAVRTPTTISRA